MPIYEYCCQKCGEFEITQRITDSTLEHCPTCGSPVKKLISNTSFKLVGTGWYLTDYARKGTPSEDGKTAKAAPDKEDGKAADTGTASDKKAAGDEKPVKGNNSASTASSS